jgi:hypothetical protein
MNWWPPLMETAKHQRVLDRVLAGLCCPPRLPATPPGTSTTNAAIPTTVSEKQLLTRLGLFCTMGLLPNHGAPR